MEPRTPNPVVKSILICRELLQDVRTKEHILIGPLSELSIRSFPTKAVVGIYFRMTSARGVYHFAWRFQDDTENVIWQNKADPPFEANNPLVEFGSRIPTSFNNRAHKLRRRAHPNQDGCPGKRRGSWLTRASVYRHEQAVHHFHRIVLLKPAFAEALNNLGNTLLRQQQTDEAIDCFRRALGLRQDYPQPYCNLGSALLQQGKAEEAVPQYEQALRLDPTYTDARFNLGNACRTLGQFAEAADCYRRVLQARPEHAGARLNLGVALSEQGRLDEAVEAFEELLRDRPDFAPACNSLGVTRLHQGRPRDALAAFERGLQLAPEDAETHLNRALTWLLLGDYGNGWNEYEWRWKMRKEMPRPYPQPAWDGTSLPQGTIVLWAEQGLGDTLQFVRYAARVKERVGTVLLDCPAALRGLLASCPGVDALVVTGGSAPAPDVQAPLMSLPRLLGTTPETIPGLVPYLFAEASLCRRWQEKLGSGPGLKVGICWQGNPRFTGDRLRSVRLEQFLPLAEVPGVRLFSLQKGPGSEQLADLAGRFPVVDVGGQTALDFRDTAAVVAGLDLVISVDTAIAHLAGALGVPVWVLLPFNPDWRWLLGREDSLWYPSARLFRQDRWGDWDGVMARVAGALRERARRPLPLSVPVSLGLAELVERIACGPTDAAEGREALRQAGVPQTTAFDRLLDALRSAHAEREAAGRDMEALAPAERAAHAADLVARYAQASRERSEALARLTAWMVEQDSAPPSVAPPERGE